MKDVNFNLLWEELILNSVNQLYNEFSKEEIERFKIEIKDVNLMKRNIQREYNSTKRALKQKYYYKGDVPLAKIDNHKIAACFCRCLLKHKMFKFKMDKDIPDKLFLINYRLAYEVSLGIIYITLLEHYVELNKSSIVKRLLEYQTLVTPETNEGHDNYNVGRIKTLALNDIYGNDFDVLTYSDMMFWIEYYNKQILENKITR